MNKTIRNAFKVALLGSAAALSTGCAVTALPGLPPIMVEPPTEPVVVRPTTNEPIIIHRRDKTTPIPR